jgi:DNA-binding CsgD family transcriptional regulator
MLGGAGAFSEARDLLEQALAGCRARGEVGGTPRVLMSFGALLARHGDRARGCAMLEASLALFRQQGEGIGVVLCSLLLGLPLPAGMVAEIGEGAVAMGWHASLGFAAPPIGNLDAWQVAAAPAYPDRLTTREVQILKLLAQRSSNNEIAEALNLSVRTVERHITNIYTKTRLSSRREALHYVRRTGLESLSPAPA